MARIFNSLADVKQTAQLACPSGLEGPHVVRALEIQMVLNTYYVSSLRLIHKEQNLYSLPDRKLVLRCDQ